MASFMDWIRQDLNLRSASVEESYGLAEENERLKHRLDDAEVKMEDLEESLLQISDAFDNVGWSPLESEQAREMPLKTVKQISEIARAMDAINPYVKRAVDARISYIWGNGVEFDQMEDATKKILRKNRHTVFSQQGYEERERALATDGNLFTALHREDNSLFRVPLAQIVGSISNPDNDEEIWYFKREWEIKSKSRIDPDGVEQKVTKTLYYPTLRYATKLEDEGKELPKRWGKFGVDQSYVIQHDAVNKQIGWRWGLPDITAVIFYAKAYKEYLEDNITLVKAYSRIAWQVKTSSQGVANSAAAQYRSVPTRDPITGEVQSAGATAITGTGTELVPTALSGSNVDFTNGKPLAAAIAAGLSVPIDVVVPESGAGSGTGAGIDLATLKTMEARQEFWANSFLDMFEFWDDDDVEVTWRNIDEDETHRRIQSVQLAYDGGLLHQEEARKEALELLRIIPTSDDMPVAPSIVAADKAAENEQAAAKAAATNVPGQGQSGSVGSVNSGRGQVKAAAKKSMANR